MFGISKCISLGVFVSDKKSKFVHNKWVTENEPINTVFSDRIEILSRGVLAPEQTIDGFFRGESISQKTEKSITLVRTFLKQKLCYL